MNENNQYQNNGIPIPPPNIPLKSCQKCKAQIGKNLKICPYCGKKQKGNIGCLGVIGIIVGVLLLLSLLTSCMNTLMGRNRRTSDETVATSAITETASPETTAIKTEPSTTAKPTTESTVIETEMESVTETIIESEATEVTIDAREAVNNGDYSVVTPEFKEMMDSYEAFYDEYIAFMKKYTSGEGDMMSMLNDYMAMLNRMEEWSSKIDSIDETTLTPADDAYYLIVTARVSAKLLGTAYGMGN